jgi:predicted RNA methylase
LTRKKELAAYYTDLRVVDYLVAWGLGVAPGIVMDPSCGDGRFLAAAAFRGARGVIGCDIDSKAVQATAQALADKEVPLSLHESDFFRIEPERVGPVDLIAGNPPFIRYQQFSGESRTRALASALRVGARLTRLSASWAPFLLHALQFLRSGGAMAMVVPAELAQTGYGIATLQALCGNFARVRLITFRHNWFEGAQQETFLLLAEGRGDSCGSAELVPLERIEQLEGLIAEPEVDDSLRLHPESDASLGLAFVQPPARGVWHALTRHPGAFQLRDLGEVTNGYVSGANAFFHCRRVEAGSRGIPLEWLVPVARNSRSLAGLRFGGEDLVVAEDEGTPHHLILPRPEDLFSAEPEALRRFIAEGERLGIPRRYKCRVRTPWWKVPGLVAGDLLLPYMIGTAPRSAVNVCHALYSNSLHGMRVFPGVAAEQIALGLLSTFSLLSMELEGRSYGGGVLKLEPTELQRVRVILPTGSDSELHHAFDEADRMLRTRDYAGATRLADQVILDGQVGLSDADLAGLRHGRAALVERRLTRGRSNR